ncbi:hypothetical protein CAPI_04065 [Corynebacterium capitovis DSM 44611]|uniref:YggS family pyridoxal phosphate-dependent enzyme n=1 Tax=Corynebacterium capitovis TaxID=131081 RepID=UPI00037E52E7|nr:YggS family pyridoxal phosphate-dependent enzyme [Corynebacterium capitovis]WKD57371.1 hypothetical protein CAPI_04065 [Corynebacterium capitovis DSM 44611]
MKRREQLRANLERVTQQVRAAEERAGRSPGSVSILPVTKFHPAEDVALLGQLGVTLVGENREQEARAKAETVGGAVGIAMIGQIQTKKANSVARWAREVHSVDSAKLARALERGVALAHERGERGSDPLPCLVQLSADGDTARGGVPEVLVDEVATEVEGAEHLVLDGFMVVPPLGADPAEVFTWAHTLVDVYSDRLGRALRLSAGMSGDFETAIACGSDVVRVGTAVLGPRAVG